MFSQIPQPLEYAEALLAHFSRLSQSTDSSTLEPTMASVACLTPIRCTQSASRSIHGPKPVGRRCAASTGSPTAAGLAKFAGWVSGSFMFLD